MTLEELQWVSEWRIEKECYFNEHKVAYPEFKVTNGGVYTPKDTLLGAETCWIENIINEKIRYIQRFKRCPNCNKTMAEHYGSISFQICLMDLAN